MEIEKGKTNNLDLIEEKKRIKIAVFHIPRGDSFLHDIINLLNNIEDYEVKKIQVTIAKEIDEGMDWADICWFEWCDSLIVYASKNKLAKDKKIICRLHSYEAFTELPQQVEWDNVDKLIFVAPHIYNNVIKKINIDLSKVSVIYNGINTNKFLYKERSKGFNIAYVGFIDYKKGPMLLIHVFKAIYDNDNRYKLYIAGNFTDERYILYFNQMIVEMGLSSNVFYEGWQQDINSWLENKDYIICTSVLEGHPVGIMESMARGIKPIIHNFYGARGLYPSKYIWNTIEEAVKLVTEEEYNSLEYSEYIKKNYSIENQIESIKNIMKELSSYDNNKNSSDDLEEMMSVKFYENSNDLYNTEKYLDYLLLKCEYEKYMKCISRWFLGCKENLSFLANYYYYRLYKNLTSYERFDYIQEDVYKRMNEISKEISINNNIKDISDKKNVIVMLCEGIDTTQSVIRVEEQLSKSLKGKYEVYIISTLAKGEFRNYEKSVQEFEENNINFYVPRSQDVDEKIKEILNKIEAVKAKCVIFQTFYFAPVAALMYQPIKQMGLKVGAFIFQQPEPYFHEEIDFVISFGSVFPNIQFKNDYKTFISVESDVIDNTIDIRKKFNIDEDKFVVISIGRDIKYNNEMFWKYINDCVDRMSEICFVFLGIDYEQYKGLVKKELVENKQIIFVNFDVNARGYLKSANAYLNSPLSGGIAIAEAYYAGLPIITTYSRKVSSNEGVNEISEKICNRYFIENDIYPEADDYEALFIFTEKIVRDKKFYDLVMKLRNIDSYELTYDYFSENLLVFLETKIFE